MNKLRNIFAIAVLIGLTACQDEDWQGGGGQIVSDSFTVSAGPISGFAVGSRSDGSTNAPTFYPHSHIMLYGTQTPSQGEESWVDNYMLANYAPGKDNKFFAMGETDAASERSSVNRILSCTEYGEERAVAQKFNTKPMNLYGVAVAVASDFPDSPQGEEAVKEAVAHTNGLLDMYREDKMVWEDHRGIPYLNVDYVSDNLHHRLHDIVWSGSLKNLTPINNSGDIVMPFVHTLSKLNFYVLPAEKMTSSIVINSLWLVDYAKGALCMETGLYDRKDEFNARNYWIDSFVFPDGLAVNPVDADSYSNTQPTLIGSDLLFPTTDADYDNPYQSGGTADDTTIEEAPDEHAVLVRLEATVNGEKKTFDNVKLTSYDKNQVFHPNCEYDITFVMTTESVVVTITPRYYEFIDESIVLKPYEVAEPVDFGGVMWATENLGATAADALNDPLSWELARGFYYQYGRNIPYYVGGSARDPFNNVSIYGYRPFADNTNLDYNKKFEYVAGDYASSWDGEQPKFLYEYSDIASGIADPANIAVPYGNTSYQFAKDHGARAYPYIPYLWEQEITAAMKTAPANYTQEQKVQYATVKGYQSFLRYCRYYSNYPNFNNGQSAPSINHSDPYKTLEVNEVKDNDAERRARYNRFAFTTYYVKNSNYLDPRYWDKNMTNPTNWHKVGQNPSDPSPKGWRLPTKAEFLSIFPSSTTCGDISFCQTVTGGGGATNPHSGKRVFREKATTDYKSLPAVYIGIYQDGEGNNDLGTISFSYTSTNKVATQQGWGSIYAIKCQGTDEAYAVRWQIKMGDADKSTGLRLSNVSPVLDAYKTGNFQKIGRGVLVISKYELNEKRANMSLHYESTGHAKEAMSKNAQYNCFGFVDADGDKNYDTGEEKITIDWDHPVGQLYMPIPGYVIVPSSGGQALIYPGCEAVYWASTGMTTSTTHAATAYFGTAVRIKYAGDVLSRFIYVSEQEHIANGANIRPVRDTKATY